MSDSEPLVTVGTFDSLLQAELARGVLEDEGIRCFVADGEIVNTAWYVAGAVGGIKLQVAKSDFLAAERLLNNRIKNVRRWNMDDYGLSKSSDGITADPESAYQENDDEEDEPENEVESPADVLVDRAWKASILGLFICPPLLHIYSVIVLLQLQSSTTLVSPEKRGRFWTAVTLNSLILGALAMVMVAVMLQASGRR